MQTISTLDEIVRELEQHEKAVRIKKLIFCACKNIWENDPTTLGCFSLQDLIAELKRLNPTLDALKVTLSKVVKSLNKQSEYSQIAIVIFNQVKKLYQDLEESTQIVSEPENKIAIQIEPQPSLQQTSNIILEYNNNGLKQAYDSFDLRQEIMKYTNPLRAKILLFSIFNNKFTFNDQDWLSLRAEELDNLLKKLFNSCPTIRNVESKLYTTASYLPESDEYTQAASAIVQALKAYYSSVQAGMPESNSDRGEDSMATCQLLQPPSKDFFKNK